MTRTLAVYSCARSGPSYECTPAGMMPRAGGALSTAWAARLLSFPFFISCPARGLFLRSIGEDASPRVSLVVPSSFDRP